MSVQVKICGINDPAAMQAAVDGGAAFVGLVFYPRSPRVVTAEQARDLVALVPASVMPVGLFVDPSDDELEKVLKLVPLKMIQLHGSETPERVKEIKKLTGLKVMKAISVGSAEDLKNVAAYEVFADMLLFDAKATGKDAMPGGNALVFDWGLLQGVKVTKPWMLAGGLNTGNLVEAARVTGAKIVDVSSGVEDAPGRKNPAKIKELIALARQL